MLEEEVINTFYNRDASGVPRQWIGKIRRAMSTITPEYILENGARLCDPILSHGSVIGEDDLSESDLKVYHATFLAFGDPDRPSRPIEGMGRTCLSMQPGAGLVVSQAGRIIGGNV